MFCTPPSLHTPIVQAAYSVWWLNIFPAHSSHLDGYVETSSHHRTNWYMGNGHISQKTHKDWSIWAEIMPIFILQNRQRILNLDKSSFQPILHTQMDKQRLLVIMGPIATLEKAILSEKITKIGQLEVKLCQYSCRSKPGLQYDMKIGIISVPIDKSLLFFLPIWPFPMWQLVL